MNLLKSLQSKLTCLTLPWKPLNANITRLINEIVLEKESDIINNNTTSHFTYYIEAIKALSKHTPELGQFLIDLNQNIDYKTLINQNYISVDVQKILNFRFKTIHTSLLHTAAAFTFGREALVADLFEPIINNPNIQENPTLVSFSNYLKRHIELDGDNHSQLTYTMIEEICKSQKDWDLVKDHAISTLNVRKELWDSILKTMPH